VGRGIGERKKITVGKAKSGSQPPKRYAENFKELRRQPGECEPQEISIKEGAETNHRRRRGTGVEKNDQRNNRSRESLKRVLLASKEEKGRGTWDSPKEGRLLKWHCSDILAV